MFKIFLIEPKTTAALKKFAESVAVSILTTKPSSVQSVRLRGTEAGVFAIVSIEGQTREKTFATCLQEPCEDYSETPGE